MQKPPASMKIFFLIRSLGTGGAERQLVNLACGLKAQGHDVHVACLYHEDTLHLQTLVKSGVIYHSLEKKHRWDVVGFFARLVRLVRQLNPDIIHGYMPLQNLLALALKPFCRAKIVCGVRHAAASIEGHDGLTKLVYAIEKKMIRCADAIISNSQAAIALYGIDHMSYVPNGIDTHLFQPNQLFKHQQRKMWNVSQDSFLVGMVGRLDPLKDYPTFLRMAHQVLQQKPKTRFVCVGALVGPYYKDYIQLSRELGLEEALIWTGEAVDMPSIYNALDVLCLTSLFEGFPNVVAEALSCGCDVVVTKAGDAALIAGEGVEVGDIGALCTKILEAMEKPTSPDIQAKRHQYIVDHYRLELLTIRTQAVLQKVLSC